MASLDPTFNPDVNGAVVSLARQPDGKILVGGSFSTVGGLTRNRIARLNADGTVDAAFNPDVTGGTVFALAHQPDGKIVIGGNFTVVGGSTFGRIARLNADGTVDAAFNPDVNGSIVFALARQPDGKILIGGNFTTVNGSTRNRIARLNADGTLDTAFNSDVDGEIRAVTLQPDGKILIGGIFSTVNAQPRSRRARLNADGTLDATFAAITISGFIRVHSIALRPDGKVLMAGDLDNYAVRQFDADGTLNGYSAGTQLTGSALVIQPDGKVIAGGSNNNANGRLVRLNADLTRDTSFTTTFSGAVEALLLQPDGKLLVGGQFTEVNGVTRNRIARLLADVVPNDEIHANDDSAATLTNTPVTVNILANDTKNGVPPVDVADLQGLPTITLPPSNGTATVNPDGTVTYTPNPGFVGTDYFDYTILGKPAGS